MVRARTTKNYIKENLTIYGDSLQRYLEELNQGGREIKAIKAVRENIRSFLARCEPMEPEQVTAKVMADVEVVMVNDNLSFNKRRSALLCMGRFLEYITGNNPYREIQEDCGEKWYVGHMGPFRFTEQLESFRAYLESTKYQPATISAKCDHVTTCCRILTKEKKILFVSQIDKECYEHLTGLMASLSKNYASKIIYDLNEFVIFCCGTNVLKQFRRSKRIGKEYCRSPQWKDFECLVDIFMKDAEERGLRPMTLSGYRKSLFEAYAHILDNFGMIYAKDIDYHIIRQAKKAMTDYRQLTVRQYLTRLGMLIEFFYGENPYIQAKLVWSLEPVERTWIFKKEWDVLWHSAELTEKVIIGLAGGMGLRRNKIATLKLCDIKDNMVTIRGKGRGKEGKIVTKQIPNSVMKCISEYMEYRTSILDINGDSSEGNLIVRDRGRLIGTPATHKYIEETLRHLEEKTGIHASCHTLRRFYCTAMSDAGMELDTIRRMMRHDRIETTLRCYLYADPRKMDVATAGVEGAIFG